MKAILITTKNEVTVGDFTFEQMRKQFKGGYAEAVKPRKLDSKFFMVVDDEGLLNGSAINMVGSYLYGTEEHGSPIVGDIFLCADIGSDFGSLSEKDAQELKALVNGIINTDFSPHGITYFWK